MPGEMNASKEMGMSPEMKASSGRGGHLYMQTNETRNCIVHYRRSANGTLTEVERIATGGRGSGTFKPISGQDSSPNAFEGAGQRDPRRRTDATCSPPTVATTRSRASASTRTAGPH